MQKCERCASPFGWGQIYEALFGWTYKPVFCRVCGIRHDITMTGRFVFVLFAIVPMIIFMNLLSPFDNLFATLGMGILILVIGSLFAPLAVRYRAEVDE